MRWTPGGVSGDIEDRRGAGGGIGIGGGGLGIGGLLILGLLSFIFKTDLVSMFSGAPTTTSAPMASGPGAVVSTPREDRQVQFVSFVLDDAQTTWDRLLPESGVPYRHAKLVLFRDSVDSACGMAESATGPFYCPSDEKVYIDLGFFDQLRSQFGAPGEFAQAYVIAHELGHHVQKILGIEGKARRLQRNSPDAANPISVRLELQADCLSGVWAHSTQQRDIVDQSDIEAGLRAAAAVGDDRLQRMATGHVSPERFTHGSSQQRMEWFQRGAKAGTVDACNTFAGQ
jgi:uncharacterized protein